MSKPILCIGRYAENPYHIEKIGRNVYCIEELCYCIVQNAFLLDEESFDSELFDWIDQECRLEKLSDELRGMAAPSVPSSQMLFPSSLQVLPTLEFFLKKKNNKRK